METGQIQDISTDPEGAGPFKLSMVLYACAWIFAGLQTLTIDTIWIWGFRILSGISLLLIIYINWNKAIEIFKSKKKKTK